MDEEVFNGGYVNYDPLRGGLYWTGVSSVHNTPVGFERRRGYYSGCDNGTYVSGCIIIYGNLDARDIKPVKSAIPVLLISDRQEGCVDLRNGQHWPSVFCAVREAARQGQ